MARYRFDEIAFNITDKRMPTPEDKELYIGLEHLDTRCLRVSRWGSAVDITGQKLVMRKGDVLFGRRNTYLRRAAIAPHDGLFSAHGMIFRPKTNVITEEFFPYFIVSDYFMDAAIRISVGSLSPTVNWKQLKELEFDIPDIDKQHKYAELFAGIDSTKEAYKQLISTTDELVKSQFVEMFGDPVQNSMGWPSKPLNDVCDGIGDGLHGTPEYDDNGGYPFINGNNLIDGKIVITPATKMVSKETYAKHLIDISPNAILISINGTLGKLAFYDGEQVMLGKSACYCNLKPSVNKVFVYGVMKSDSFVEFLDNSSTKSTIKNVGLRAMREYKLILPPEELQRQFAAFVAQTDKSKFVAHQATSYTDSMI